MLHVDALSRQIFVIEDNSFDKNLALCQVNDPAITKIRKELELSENKLFDMRNGLVYKKTSRTYFILRSHRIRD